MSFFYLGAITTKTLEVYSCVEVPEDDVLKLYGDPDLTKQALKKLEAQFEPPASLMRRIFRVTRREFQELSRGVLDLAEQIRDRDHDSFVALSYRPLGHISRKKRKEGREIARNRRLLGGAPKE